MNDDDLKALYKQSSDESPDRHIDDLILAQAAEELEENQTKTTTWRPLMATAASLTLVVALVVQLIPEKQLELEESMSPLSRMKTEPLMPSGAKKPAVAEASLASDNQAEIALESEQTETVIVVTGSRIRPAEENVSDYAHSKADAARQARIAEAQRLRKESLKTAELADVSSDFAAALPAQKVLDQASILEELNQILRLYESKDVEAAKTRWQQFKKMNLNIPENEEIQALWAKLEDLLQ